MTSAKEDHYPIPWVLPAVLSHKLLHLVYVTYVVNICNVHIYEIIKKYNVFLKSSYWQIGLSEKSKLYFAFVILYRVMKFNVTNLKGITWFLDFGNFYARLVKNYVKVTITWLKLIKKHVRFKWQKKYNSLVSHLLREKTILG